MKLISTLLAPFVLLREWLFPEHSLCVLEMVRLLKTYPKEFEINVPKPGGDAVIALRPGSFVFAVQSVMSDALVRLSPKGIWLDIPPHLPFDLDRRDQLALMAGVQSWLALV